jgi:hypothetical protein
MSHIPNSAIPHAAAAEDAPEETSPTLKQRAGTLAGKARATARANPKTAIAAGAALVAGAVAAAAIPKVRAARAKPARKKGPASAKKKS